MSQPITIKGNGPGPEKPFDAAARRILLDLVITWHTAQLNYQEKGDAVGRPPWEVYRDIEVFIESLCKQAKK